jgi:cellulose synthase (UDP-forming)
VFLCFGILPVSSDAPTFALHFLPFMAANQLLFLVSSRGIRTWRGQQYSLALFPVWIRATITAAASVLLRRPLAFAVTPKVRPAGAVPLRPIRVQLATAVVLVVATGIGVVRLLLGVGEPIGTLVNTFWAAFDLAALGVLVRAVRYHGFPVEKEEDEWTSDSSSASTASPCCGSAAR